MEAIDVGWLSILPPILAIGLALISKEVISSLLIGILAGTFIYAFQTGDSVIDAISITLNLMTQKIGDNASILLFLAFLGALVAVVTMAGGSKAYGNWATQKIKSRKGAQLATSALGCLIFIDDYFNCLTIGTVMRPVTDKYNISRAKLAYIIDATAAPVCIIAPISSWAASVISQIEDAGTNLNGMQTFMQCIPYNLYALLTIIMVIFLCVTNLEFGSMAKFENKALKQHNVGASENGTAGDDELSRLSVSEKGHVFDLIIPIFALIVFSILAMLYVGGYFQGGMSIADGFGNTDAGPALALGGFGALIVAFLLFVPRKLLPFRRFMDGIGIGVRSMVSAFIILILAWTISGVCRDLLNTGVYVGHLVESSSMPPALIPAGIFVVASLLSFSMGTSWGTFTILIPIIALVCQSVAPELMVISISATLAGSVLGDHCSPISDTTILSSTGAGCCHMDHVSTQIPYVLLVGIVCIIGYLIAGFTKNLWMTLAVSIILLFVILFLLHKKSEKEENIEVEA